MSQLPSHALKRVHISSTHNCCSQTRHASLLRRPHRPYTFTQLITLSDGSSYLTRTTSPAPVYKSTKDTRNHPLWQPTLSSLRNVEQDEAGRLRAFRDKFGRAWDAEEVEVQGKDAGGKEGGLEGSGKGEEKDSLMDLISGASGNERERMQKEALAEAERNKEPSVVREVKMVTVLQDGKLVKVPVKKK